MIYPRDIVDFVEKKKDAALEFANAILGSGSHSINKGDSRDIDIGFETWMIREGIYESAAVRRYVFYLSTMSNIFHAIRHLFERENPDSRSEIDKAAVTTTVEEMMSIARYLYYLDSYGIQGDILECGCFRGFSSCCLSWACSFLGRQLIIADSFQGLPDVGSVFYHKHEFSSGGMESVRNTINTLGRIDCVSFVPGWYEESLRGFNQPLCLLWLDVDLGKSVSDVLQNVFASIRREGVIFSHEFSGECVKHARVKTVGRVGEVPKAINDFFARNNVPYAARYLTGWLAVIVPFMDSGNVRVSPLKQDYLTYSPQADIKASADISQLKKKWGSTTRCGYSRLNELDISKTRVVQIYDSDEIILSGWAVDDSVRDSAGGAVIDIDGRLFPALYGFPRDDISEELHSCINRNCGFKALIPIDKIGSGVHTIGIKVISRNEKYFFDPHCLMTCEIIT